MKSGKNSVVKIPFRCLLNPTTAPGTGLATIGFSPATVNSRLATLADSFDLFRLVEMRFRLIPNSTGQAMCWSPGIADTPPASIAAINEVLSSCQLPSVAVAMGNWVTVPKAELAGSLPWYKTVAGTPESWDEQPGQFYFAGNGSATCFAELEGVIEFKGAIDAASTPALRAKTHMARERERLLAILASEKSTSVYNVCGPSGKADLRSARDKALP